jgi:hypothetical protein
MGLAVHTTASTAEIWVIVVAMSILTFILAAAPALGGWLQRRASENRPDRLERPAQAAGDVAASEPHAGPVAVPPQRSGAAGEAGAGAAPYAGSGARRDGRSGREAPGR